MRAIKDDTVLRAMALAMLSVWERYVLKKRYILGYTLQDFPADPHVFFATMDRLVLADWYPHADAPLQALLDLRAGSPDWVFFAYRSPEAWMGYCFLHVPRETQWNDALPTHLGEARISSNFVWPQYRGRGISQRLLRQQSRYLFGQALRPWGVIERANRAALRAAARMGSEVIDTNYLVKLCGRNVLSIRLRPWRCYLLWGARRANR